MKHTPGPWSALALSAAPAVTLAACTSSDPEPAEPTAAAVEPTPETGTDEDTETVAVTEVDDAGAGVVGSTEGLVTAPWAHPAQNVGEELATVQLASLSVRINDSGRFPGTRDQYFSDGTQALAEGAPVVYLSWTVTNTGDEPVRLGASMVNVRPTADGRNLGYDTNEGFRELGLSPDAVKEYHEDNIYVLGPGESFTEGMNFPLGEIDVLDLDLTFTPRSADGDLEHDLAVNERISVPLART
ncbi:hypothetical protein [Cellulomonas triticagri]|uniref:DUF4352 domain-containing protein n=1 Tax=Cellulomonas triticagri TaxID=2483352 RepID=A0A3M2JJA7_9CELL|nr:hypothetical protein [Cellulomonas triticagri]RMI13882.1 hypothetical protein EBM89_02615 [Cellulomonas triticagri]